MALACSLVVAGLAALSTKVHAAGQAGRLKHVTVPRIYEAGGCDTYKVLMEVHSVNIGLDAHGGEYVFGEFTLQRGFKFIKKLTIKTTRCQTGGVSASSCEYFATWTWGTALCPLTQARGLLWTPVVQSLEPPIKCPFGPGRYRLNNGTLDFEALSAILVGDTTMLYKYIWIGEVMLHNEDDGLGICFNVTFALRRMRVRN